MAKYYALLFLAVGIVLYYIFIQDPCSNKIKTDFSRKYPDYKILNSGAGQTSLDNVNCHIHYRKPDSNQVYEDVWLYQKSGNEWSFSKILRTIRKEPR